MPVHKVSTTRPKHNDRMMRFNMYFEASLHGLKERGGWGGAAPHLQTERFLSSSLPSYS